MKYSNNELLKIINPMPSARYCITVPVSSVKRTLDGWGENGSTNVNINPDFQRGRVWSLNKQIAYMENLIRGYAPNKILFNCPEFLYSCGNDCDLNPNEIVCIDGLQRISSALDFMGGKFKLFNGKLSYSDLNCSHFSTKRIHFEFQMYEIAKRAELLQFYLSLNTGGVVHSKSEIQRVRDLLNQSLG